MTENMQFQIPQFIDVESKLVGPLTLRQFLFLAAAGGISVFAWVLFRGWLWFLITAIAAVVAVALAFIKYQGRSLPQVALNAFGFLWKPRLYLWQKEKEKTLADDIRKIKIPGLQAQNLFTMASVKKLMQDLMTSKHPIEKREKNNPESLEQKLKYNFTVIKKTSGDEQVAKKINY